MKEYAGWEFPLPRTHTGIMAGNGTTGLLVWGEGEKLKITFGRADLWDHRGGMRWTEKQNYSDIRKCLENRDKKGLDRIFACDTEGVPGSPRRPSVLPLGRLDLLLPEGAKLKAGCLNLKTGSIEITYAGLGGERKIILQIAMDKQVVLLELPEDEIGTRAVPAWEFKSNYFSSISFEPPVFLTENSLKGWIQKLPADPAVCVAWKIDGNKIWAVTDRSENADDISEKINAAIEKGSEKFTASNKKWWGGYWNKIPEINLPNKKLEFVYNYGLYKFAGFTNPSAVPATLQGPWIEEYEMPPWSSDYHFNINVQMCYWPAYKANLSEHLKPLFNMIWRWKDILRHNAKVFTGIDDGYMLPHAVDDRCTCMGSFWTGTVDHACSAWIAQMMYSYYRHTGDMDFLKEVAFPFMKGVMRVYEAMLEEQDGHYVLPLSVSPEYRGADIDAWGRNASFQLAAVHRLCEDLINASAELGEPVSRKWVDISKKLPEASLTDEKGQEKIALWEGTDLEFSHRHHSHLAAIVPFDTIDIYSNKWAPVISKTINHWIEKGMGQWSGWSIPWASMIHSRLENGDAAETLIELWEKFFTNEGYGSLHDCNAAGISIMGAPSFKNIIPRRGDIMQMDGGMGSVVAVQDMLMHSRRGIVHVFPGAPRSWKFANFKDMPAGDGFMISATLENRKISGIKVKAVRRGKLKLANPVTGGRVKIILSNGRESISSDNVLKICLGAGEQCRVVCL